MDEASLKQSLQLYRSQLEQIEQSLQIAGADRELLQLREEMRELILLTEEGLLALVKSRTLTELDRTFQQGQSTSSVTGNSLDEEYAAFQASLGETQTASTTVYNQEVHTSNPSITDQISSIVGMKCRAPFVHEWGSTGYFNAIVTSVEESDNSDDVPKVNVMYCNPTSTKMVPCSYHLEGKCRFSKERCKYSHGNTVDIEDLEEFKEPDFSSLHLDSPCLVCYDDDVWYRAKVVDILDNHQFTVSFDNYGDTRTVDIADVLPLDGDEEDYRDRSPQENKEEEEELSGHHGNSNPQENEEELPVYLWKPPQTTEAMGGWEAHTKDSRIKENPKWSGQSRSAPVLQSIGERISARQISGNQDVPYRFQPRDQHFHNQRALQDDRVRWGPPQNWSRPIATYGGRNEVTLRDKFRSSPTDGSRRRGPLLNNPPGYPLIGRETERDSYLNEQSRPTLTERRKDMAPLQRDSERQYSERDTFMGPPILNSSLQQPARQAPRAHASREVGYSPSGQMKHPVMNTLYKLDRRNLSNASQSWIPSDPKLVKPKTASGGLTSSHSDSARDPTRDIDQLNNPIGASSSADDSSPLKRSAEESESMENSESGETKKRKRPRRPKKKWKRGLHAKWTPKTAHQFQKCPFPSCKEKSKRLKWHVSEEHLNPIFKRINFSQKPVHHLQRKRALEWLAQRIVHPEAGIDDLVTLLNKSNIIHNNSMLADVDIRNMTAMCRAMNWDIPPAFTIHPINSPGVLLFWRCLLNLVMLLNPSDQELFIKEPIEDLMKQVRPTSDSSQQPAQTDSDLQANIAERMELAKAENQRRKRNAPNTNRFVIRSSKLQGTVDNLIGNNSESAFQKEKGEYGATATVKATDGNKDKQTNWRGDNSHFGRGATVTSGVNIGTVAWGSGALRPELEKQHEKHTGTNFMESRGSFGTTSAVETQNQQEYNRENCLDQKIKDLRHQNVSDRDDFTMRGFDCFLHLDEACRTLRIRSPIMDPLKAVLRNQTEPPWPKYPVTIVGGVIVYDDPSSYPSCVPSGNSWTVAFGVHPKFAPFLKENQYQHLERLLRHPKRALGVIGYDFTEHKTYWDFQNEVFAKLLNLCKTDRPVILNIRGTTGDLFASGVHQKCFEKMKQRCSRIQKIHIHSFTGTIQEVRMWTAYFTNCYFGFTWNIESFSDFQIKALKEIPNNRLLLETGSKGDSIFDDKSYGIKQPAFLGELASTIAEVKGCTVKDMLRQTLENSRRLYGADH